MKNKFINVIFIFGILIIFLLWLKLSYNKDNNVQFQEISIDCVSPFDLARDLEYKNGAYISTQQDYEFIMKYKRKTPNCEDFKFPLIDFSKYSLLAKSSGGGICTKFKKEIVKDDINKKIIYSIHSSESYLCYLKYGFTIPTIGYMDMNWILIPKVPDGYVVEFVEK